MTNEFAIAVHALVYLNHVGRDVPSDKLAENVCTNPVCIRKVMGKLKKAGMIGTKEGLGGGYHIAVDADKLDLRVVSAALKVQPVKSSWRSGNPKDACKICSQMAGIMDELVEDMNAVCEEYLQKTTIKDIEEKIFQKE